MGLRTVINGPSIHDVDVTYLKGAGYSIRVLVDGKVNQTSVVKDKIDVGPEIRSMLRMEDKCGNISNMAHRSRMRPGEKEHKHKTKQNNETNH